MSWITLTEAAFVSSLTGPELTAVQTAALKPGQMDPLPVTIAKAVQDIRGYVAVKNQLAPGETLPPQLEADAIAVIRYRVLGRLPVKSLITESRAQEYKDALAKFRDVARGTFKVDAPDTVSEQPISSDAAVEIVSAPKREITRDTFRF